MGVYPRLKRYLPRQSCVLCGEQSVFCVCKTCAASLSTSLHRCASCACQLDAGLNFCGACLSNAPYFAQSYTLYDYAGSCAQLIKQFKFNQQLCVGDYFAHQLYDWFVGNIQRNHYDAIIPMPLSTARIRQRGYNQAYELLRVIKRKTDIPIDIASVTRSKATVALSSLNLAERQVAIKGAFSLSNINYQTVLLVDDVMTTGASLNELAKTLIKQGGVKQCDVVTLARA